jgi:hypothetical protein
VYTDSQYTSMNTFSALPMLFIHLSQQKECSNNWERANVYPICWFNTIYFLQRPVSLSICGSVLYFVKHGILVKWCRHIYLFTHGSSDHMRVSSKGRMLIQQRIRKQVEGSRCGLIWGTILAWGTDRKKHTQETSSWAAGVPVKIWSRHLPNTNQND